MLVVKVDVYVELCVRVDVAAGTVAVVVCPCQCWCVSVAMQVCWQLQRWWRRCGKRSLKVTIERKVKSIAGPMRERKESMIPNMSMNSDMMYKFQW